MAKSMNSRDLVKKLEADGWRLTRTKGDHRQYKHLTDPALITVTHPVRDIPIGNLRRIFRIAGRDWPP